MRPTRQHKYDDYVPDESNTTYDMVKITNTNNCNGIQQIGYLNRHNTNQFRFTSVEFCNEYCHESDSYESEILNYKDWIVQYIK